MAVSNSKNRQKKTGTKSGENAISVSDGAREVLNTQDFVPYLVDQISVRMNVSFKADLKKHRMSHSHWSVLLALARRGPLSLTELAQITVIEQPSLSRIIDQMVERELVERASREDDGRFLSISVTDHGVRRFVELSKIAHRHAQKMVSELNGDETNKLRMYLRRVLKALTPD